MAALPQGYQLPPMAPRLPSASEVAWLAVVPTSAPALSEVEVLRVRSIRDGATDARVRARAEEVLAANGTA